MQTVAVRVKATREGLVGHTTASGYIIDRHVPFVALPSTRALRRFVRLSNPANGRSCIAIVLDVGPWFTNDDAYVFTKVRPLAENGVDDRGRTTNQAGIDLSERVWVELAMRDNGLIDWEFIE